MAVVTALSNKKLLIIDDLPGMRTQMKLSMAALGFEKVVVVADSKAALAALAVGKFDIILCDYYLGDTTNGQQFLEYLRQQRLIEPWVIFIMVTAERSYDQVMRAAEVLPDDYLVKPFTAGQLQARLDKLLDKRDRFYEVDDALARQDWAGVALACEQLMARGDKSYMDAARIRGDALLQLGRAADAEAHFRQIIAVRPLGWANLGLAKALLAKGEQDTAENLLRETIADNPQLMAAYDTLSVVLAGGGKAQQALDLLQQATTISPGTLARSRSLGKLAASVGDQELAENTLKDMLRQHQHSPVKEAGDFTVLARVLAEQGKTDEALATVGAGKAALGNSAGRALDIAEALVQATVGNGDAAQQLLAGIDGDGDLPADQAAELARACYLSGDSERGDQVLRQLVQSDPDNAEVAAVAERVLVASGRADEGKQMVAALIQECTDINNAGVRLAYEGRYSEASQLLDEAAARVPGNLQFLGNAALVLAAAMLKEGVSEARMQACVAYRQALASRDPQHGKLAQLDAALKKLRAGGA